MRELDRVSTAEQLRSVGLKKEFKDFDTISSAHHMERVGFEIDFRNLVGYQEQIKSCLLDLW